MKKKKPAKLLSAVLGCSLIAACLPLSAVSASAAEIGDIDDIPSITVETDDNGITTYYDENGNEVSLSDLNRSVGAGDTKLPSSYDLRDYNRVTPVRNQGNHSFCWAFGSTASVESSVLSQPSLAAKLGDNAYQTLHLAEVATPYFYMTNISDETSMLYNDYYNDASKGSNGGEEYKYASGLSAGYGSYFESLCSYETDDDNIYNESLRYYSAYALKDFSVYSESETDDLKASIMENGAATVEYSTYEACYNNGVAFCDINYTPQVDEYGGGHVVSIIGWDDNYSRENFKEANRPQNDGAWLCKDSHGENQHDNGYFWMSYETESITKYSNFTVQSNDTFDNRYQNSIAFENDVNCIKATGFDKSANVFTASSSETLEQVSVATAGSYDYKISVYRLNDNFETPEDGTLLTSVSGSEDKTGIHTVDITDEVYLESGDVFSVVVENVGDSTAYIWTDCALEKTRTAKTAYYGNEDGWGDCVDLKSSGKTDAGYPFIKAFTKNTDNSAAYEKLEQAIENAEAVLAAAPNEASQSSIDAFSEQIEASKSVLNEKSCGAVEVNNNVILLNRQANYIENAVYYINSLDDYYSLIEKLHCDETDPQEIVLNTDLDFADKGEIYSLCTDGKSFIAKFNGNGHTIKNAEIVSKNYNPGYHDFSVDGLTAAAFFGEAEDAEISNVRFENCSVSGVNSCAMVCASADNTVLKDIDVVNCTVLPSDAYDLDFEDVKCASLCTEISGETVVEGCSVTGCTLNGTYVYELTNASAYTDCSTSGNTLAAYKDLHVFNADAQADKHIGVVYQTESENYKTVLQAGNVDDVTLYVCNDGVSTVEAASGCELTKQSNGYKAEFTADEAVINYTEVIPENETCFTCRMNFDNHKLVLTGVKDAYFDSGTETLELPSMLAGTEVTKIGVNICSKNVIYEVKSLIIPDTVTEICGDAFLGSATDGMLNLQSLTVGSGIKKLDTRSWFLMNPSHLEELNLSEGLETIAEDAFFGLSSLKTVTLPDSLKEIGDNAFCGTSVTEFTFGKNIDSIGEYAIGYTTEIIPWENSRKAKLPNVVINGYAGTAAETYAEENGFTFINLDEQEAVSIDPFDYDLFKPGDVNLDGTVDICDATMIQKYLAKITTLNDVQLVNCSVYTCKNTLSIENATAIQKYLAKILPSVDPDYVKPEVKTDIKEKG